MPRYYAGPDDWPLANRWYSVYDAMELGRKLNLRPGVCGGWRYGKIAAEKLAERLNSKRSRTKDGGEKQ